MRARRRPRPADTMRLVVHSAAGASDGAKELCLGQKHAIVVHCVAAPACRRGRIFSLWCFLLLCSVFSLRACALVCLRLGLGQLRAPQAASRGEAFPPGNGSWRRSTRRPID